MAKRKKKRKPASRKRKTAAKKKTIEALQYPDHLAENRVIEELRQTVQTLKVFDSLGKTLASSLELSEVLRMVIEKLGNLIECTHCGLILLNSDEKTFYFEYPRRQAEPDQTIPIGRGILGSSLERGRGELFDSPQSEPLFHQAVDAYIVDDPQSMITMPIVSKGRVLGVLTFVTTPEEKPLDHKKFRLIETFSDYLAIAIENSRAYKKVEELTITDDLTKLYNSRYLHIILDREIALSRRYDAHCALVFIDLDNFKETNDKYGHLAGSGLLTEFGEFLLREIRNSDVAIRYGGDEFILVLPRTTKAAATQVVHRMLDSLREKVFLKKQHINSKLTASFGLACFPDDAADTDSLIAAADKAMYIVKKGSKDGVHASGDLAAIKDFQSYKTKRKPKS